MRSLLISLICIVIVVLLHILLVHTDKHQFSSIPNPPTIVLKNDIYAHTVYDSLTPEQRAGQHLFVSISPGMTEQELKDLFLSIHPGGVLLFSSNISSASQTKELTRLLQQIAKENGEPPLFIAVDEEGGIVERIWFSPVEYSAFELGSINSEDTTKTTARNTAETLKSLGITVNFAPVADTAFFPNSVMKYRSFGNSPQTVAQHVTWTTDEYIKNGIMSTVKHFPGHGRTSADSHQTLPLIDLSKEDWLNSDAIPFTAAIEAGIPFIMSGHIQYPSIDSMPASSSHVWLTQILREEMEYTGIIVSDDIKMEAYNQEYPTTALQFIDAGNDMIIAAVDTGSLVGIAAAINTHLESEEHTNEERISTLRILRTKYGIVDTAMNE